MKNFRIVALAVLFAAPLAMHAQSTGTIAKTQKGMTANAQNNNRFSPIGVSKPAPGFYKKNPYWAPNRDWTYIMESQVG